MKSFARILAICMVFTFIASCTATPAATTAPATVAPATVEPQPRQPRRTLTPAEQWAKDNGVGPYQAATEDWAAVEAAAKEGSVVVYSNSSRIQDAAAIWQLCIPISRLKPTTWVAQKSSPRCRKSKKPEPLPEMSGSMPRVRIW